jgi:hypothetical protein
MPATLHRILILAICLAPTQALAGQPSQADVTDFIAQFGGYWHDFGTGAKDPSYHWAGLSYTIGTITGAAATMIAITSTESDTEYDKGVPPATCSRGVTTAARYTFDVRYIKGVEMTPSSALWTLDCYSITCWGRPICQTYRFNNSAKLPTVRVRPETS